MSLPVTIRPAAPEDAEALLSIYAPYVKHTAITFEYEVPSAEEFRKRIAHTLQHYPYLVAEREINSSAPGIKDEGNCSACTEIAGYAYAGPLHARAAYAWSVETSIYVRESERKSGNKNWQSGYKPNCLRLFTSAICGRYGRHGRILVKARVPQEIHGKLM